MPGRQPFCGKGKPALREMCESNRDQPRDGSGMCGRPTGGALVGERIRRPLSAADKFKRLAVVAFVFHLQQLALGAVPEVAVELAGELVVLGLDRPALCLDGLGDRKSTRLNSSH